MTPEQKQAWDMQQSGMTRQQIADELGIAVSSVKSRLERARKWINADPQVAKTAQEFGMEDVSQMDHYWRRYPTEDGGFVTGHFRNAVSSEETDILEDIAEAFKDIPTVDLGFPAHDTEGDKLALYALADIHLGMRAWGDETGDDYDTDIASARVTDGMRQLIHATEAATDAVIVSIGDSLHANDDTAQTPQSKHVLDVDSRHYRVLDVAIDMFAASVDLAAQKHRNVTFCILPGNHDRDAYRAIMFAMRERYRNHERIKIVADPMEFFVHEFGKVMIACHHGDKAKAERLVLDAADRWPEMWGRTRHRVYFTGHLHHHKSADIGGMTWEQLRAVTAKDAYASGHSYSAKAQMQSIVFDKERGETTRHKVSF